jgi:C1A family cysteine protease
MANKIHFKNTSGIEKDQMTNDEMKQIVNQQPIGIGMFSTSILMGYSGGVITNQFLDCSNPREEVNHGVTLVGYGKVTDERIKTHCKEDYWIIRNSWGRNWGE